MALDNDLNTRSVSWDDEVSNCDEAQDEVGSMTRPRIKGAANRSIETPIHTHPTFDSSDVEDGSGGSRDLSHKKKVMMDSTYREIFEQTEKARVRANSEDTGDTNATMFTHFERNVNHALYIGLFATFGTVIRIYLGRFFGLDCEQGTDGVDDFLASFSSNICVTASGKTQQTGGALFSDLPANMLGCFMIGVLSPAVAVGHPIPWFRKEHPLQNHDGFLTALKIGFCGCLTTCASWNTQMVVMLDGSKTVLGPQVAPALCGYLIGGCCTVASFIFGRHVHEWLKMWTSAELQQELLDEASVHSTASSASRAAEYIWKRIVTLLGIKVAPFLLYFGLAAAFGFADGVLGIPFYRKMWMSVIVSPLGALCRWRLSLWNNRKLWKRFAWVPWGTLAANVLAAVISDLVEAIESRYITPDQTHYQWSVAALNAVEAGFAGSMSTVSTLVKEMFDLAVENPSRAYLYFLATTLSGMLLGLLVYSPIVRS